jgi:microcystin-dependent protein
MTDNYLGEIRLFSFDYAPQGWHLCDGSLLNVQQNMALFSLLGNTYGGDGKTTFALPDLRGRTAIDMGQKNAELAYHKLGEAKGQEEVTLATQEMPKHNHLMLVDSSAGNKAIATNIPAIPTKDNVQVNLYNTGNTAVVPLHTATVGVTGGNGMHNNMQPFLTVNFCIATQGIYPPRP